ncbi:TetR family transcriptional regulator [Catellatospora citrea]|uniref:TetR family transcriptional regulator n=1 Tax=Catellatospora citrea TaxID=53366 RepID=A0A8J3KKH8_9ACTN|nr:TetR family transcriptional regulator [Catellatospora citrea]GIG01708.1 TetR family transcriptional regulator [Catellatospora citrea]
MGSVTHTDNGSSPAAEQAARGRAADTSRGEQTRQAIVASAIRLFGEAGYEKTTMRAIAADAGVSVGNAYYYFPAKEALVSEFYLELQREHLARVEPILRSGTSFGDRLAAILREGIEVWAPHHAFAGRFIGIAAVPGSPVSPFSAESGEARELATSIFHRLVDSTETKMDPQLRARLPQLLWLAQLGLVVYWVHDTTPGQRRTRAVVDLAVPYLEYLVGASRMKIFKPLTTRGLTLLDALWPHAAE